MPYDASYFDDINRGSESSAAALVPPLIDLIAPDSVVDVGCGEGLWLSKCKQTGPISQSHGFDVSDCPCPRFSNNPGVSWWYKQNAVLYCHHSRSGQLALRAGVKRVGAAGILPLVHPGLLKLVPSRLVQTLRAPRGSQA